MNKLMLRAAEARQNLTNAKARGFRNVLAEDGAIDLASIMVGVLVIGIVGGVIAATVFAVIPWAQDEAAKQSLSAVATAESVQFAQSSGDGAGVFVDDDALVDAELIQASEKIQIVVPANGKSYVAYSLSDTGLVFSADNTDPNTAVKLTDTEVTAAGLTTTGGVLAYTAP